jgi:transcriptional regulator with XRE-family HTH domain
MVVLGTHDVRSDSIDVGEPAGPSLDEAARRVLAKLDEAGRLSEQLQAFSKDLGLRDRELMKLGGMSRATLSRWRKSGDAERPPALDDLRVIAALLIRSGAMRPRSVAGWLRSRNLGLKQERPLDVLVSGEFSRVLSAAESACGGRVPVERLSESEAPDSSFVGSMAQDQG